MDEAGILPRKRHGQCFLTDAQAVDAIVRDAAVNPEDHVVEIGTGTGLLTHALCEAGASVETFDLDGAIVEFTRRLREWPGRIVFHVADALQGKHDLSPDLLAALARARAHAAPGHAKFVSNLPYNAATPVLLSLLALEDPPDLVVAMVQAELAEKLLASEDSPAYGPPSVLRALTADGSVLRRFPPQVFWPMPAVTSAVVRLVPRRPSDLRPHEARAFATFLLGVFSRRRKVLASALRAARPALPAEAALAAIAGAGVDSRVRPEAVAPAALLALFRRTSP